MSTAARELDLSPSSDLRELALAQRRFWLIHELFPGQVVDTVSYALRLQGAWEPGLLRQALDLLAARHESWRTTFHTVGGAPMRRVHPPGPCQLEELDLSGLEAALLEERRQEARARFVRRPFDLSRELPLRGLLVRLGPARSELVVAFAHAAGDGFAGFRLLPDELAAAYRGLAAGQSPPLPPPAANYEDFLRQEREEHEGQALQRKLDYYRSHLAGAPAALELPLDLPRPAAWDPSGARAIRRLDGAAARRVKALARRLGATPADVLFSAWAALLHRLSGAEDLVIGQPLHNRTRPELMDVFGCCMTTLPRRVDASGDPSFAELVRRGRAQREQAHPHRALSLQGLLSNLPPGPRDPSRNPIYQVLFNHLGFGERRVELPGGLTLELERVDPGRAMVDLDLDVADLRDGIELSLEYATRLFLPATAARLLELYANLLESAAADPEQAISRLNLLSPAMRRQLVEEWNATDGPFPDSLLLHQPFEAQAARTPAAVALACGEQTRSYAELEAAANRLARRLQALGVGTGDLVGVCLSRSFAMVETVLGVLKAGGAYVPLDPAYPADRLAFMLEDTGARVVVTERSLAGRLPQDRARLLVVEDEVEALAGLSAERPPCGSHPDQVAYIIYTSGSTGRPKGVVVRHRPAVNLTDWVNTTFAVGPDDRLLFVTSLSFDLSVYDIFGILGTGASLRIATGEELREPERLVAWLDSGEITYWDSAPPALVQLRPFFPATPGRSRLRLVFLSGDWIPVPLPDQIRAAYPGAEVVSLGGATEATVWSNFYRIGRVDPAWPSIPYGKPIRNARYYVLDRWLAPLPVGVPGELFIGGPCLADGYLNRAELTAERFLPDPFSSDPAARIYRTGDLARFFADGNIEFLGRIDHQVKVRGYRIELGEIEAVLNAFPGVKGSLVLAPRDASGERSLVGYVLAAAAGWDEGALRAHARGKLPDYMVPAHLVRLDAFPLTANGKVDRAALPSPARGAEGGYVAPRGELEERVGAVWAEVLGLARVGRDDDFFALGGHSLLATRVIARLRDRLGTRLPVRALFDASTLERFAERVAAAGRAQAAAEEAAAAAAATLALAQEVFWYQAQLDPSSTAYTIQLSLRLRGALDPTQVEAAVAALVARHEPLRTGFVSRDGEVRLEVLPPGPVPLARERAAAGLSAEDAVAAAAAALARAPFDLARPPLLRAALLELAPDDHALVLAVHHIVADGWSLGLIEAELTAALAALRAGRPAEAAWAPLPSSYASFAAWQAATMAREGAALLAWWREQLRELPPPLSLAEERLLAAPRGRGSATCLRPLPPELSARIRRAAQAGATTPYAVLLAGFSLVLQRWTGRTDVVVGSPVAGRERTEDEGLIGCFVNTLVLRTRVDPERGFAELLQAARETTLGALAHAELPFHHLVRELAPRRSGEDPNPLFELFFNYLTPSRVGPAPVPGLEVERLETRDIQHKFELTLYVHEAPERFSLELVHDADRISPERAAALAEQLEQALEQGLAAPRRPLCELSLLTPAARRGLPDPARPLDAGRGGALQQAFLSRAAAHPDRPALLSESGAWSYGELEGASARVAAALLAAGVRPGDLVAVHAARGPALVAALLGVLRAGGAWAILDPAHPGERLARCLEVAGPRALLVLAEAPPLDPALARAARALPRVEVPAGPPRGARAAGVALPPPDPDRLAYVAFTSGSTGLPKAVEGTHRPVTHFLAWQAARFGLSERDRSALLAGLGHDPLLRDVFAPLSLGGQVAIPPEEARRDPAALHAFLLRHEVTFLHLTPALAQLLALAPAGAGSLPALRLACFGGDRLRGGDLAAWRRLAPGCRAVNLYGTTETPQGMGVWEVEDGLPERAPAPLGQGIDDVQLLVLTGRGELAAPGELGEIAVRTPYLALGYRGDPAGTAARFVPGPAALGPWDRVYRTGDLGRWDARGRVDYVRRGEGGQVQVRGYRVELGEVEAALLAQPGVSRALARLEPDPAGSDPRLVAWAAVEPGVGGEALRQGLRRLLPEPMLPSAVVALERFPLTPNGKVDVAALPRFGAAAPSARGYLAPRDAIEVLVAGLWAELLGRERVGAEDDFFLLGGHSLLAVRMLALLGQRLGGVTLPVGLLLRAPTVAALAHALGRRAWEEEEPLVVRIQVGEPGRLPLWIVHPIGGHVVFAQRLARYADPARPIYGIQARGLDGKGEPLRSVEEMATHYVELMRRVQPEGPWCLAGPSFGGTVAYEMAQQLAARGLPVGLVGLFDTFGPGYPDRKELPARLLDHLRHAARLSWRERVAYVSERVQSRLGGRDLRFERYDVEAEARSEGQLVEAVRRVIAANYDASTAYEERPYPGRVVLFRATRRPDFPGTTFADMTNGWHRVARGGVEVVPVDCAHQWIMDEPAVATVGRELERLLGELERSRSAGGGRRGAGALPG